MKKFVFAAIAAMVMVSVSNVFASSKMMIDNSEVVPVDTVAPETPKDFASGGCRGFNRAGDACRDNSRVCRNNPI